VPCVRVGRQEGNGQGKPARAASSPPLRSSPPRQHLAASAADDVDLSTLLPDDMQCLLSVLEGIESVATLKRGSRSKYVMFRGDKEGVESGAKRSFKVCSVSSLPGRKL
jgi:hypothetical protein